MNPRTIYPMPQDPHTCLLKNTIKNSHIIVGDYTYYHDMVDPLKFESSNVLYHYPVNNDKLIIGNYCSIASGATFLFNGGNHKAESFVNYPFAIFRDMWEQDVAVHDSWDNKGDIVVGNDVWIGYEAVIMAGVTIGDGARIGTRAVVTKDVEPYEVVGGVPARHISMRFEPDVIELLLRLAWWDLDIDTLKPLIPVLMKADRAALKQLVHRLCPED
ncbi:virginiamycin A acetyltransferase [Desulfoluna spongiiphila]|uniref:Virginiamycin A acetyltransferase n=1 Tax=Desulfoluna spongiiphila TaxID=419481 RepID=A0A1G5DWP4_9BACT|nr:CatB-related O-acetyltransferase [Desulfoluna spongiiphila]SCY18910.1 virginiamycin A acetyltransferase [Desulfoluna spongiiphila]